MNKDKIRYLVLSDIHLGNKRNKTSDMIQALDVFFNHYQPRTDLDVIFIAGDVFDRLLDFPSDDVPLIVSWGRRLERFCGQNNIKLRVLEGTRSHDWGQSRFFETIHGVVDSNVNLRYVDTLSIEFMEDLGISILYVPDEWNTSTDKTYEQVKELLNTHHIDKVDIAIMHGMFAYQAPIQTTRLPLHDEIKYLSIVKYFISIGHIHTSSVYERILAQGSFDRISHGEEEPKGAMECVIYKEGHGEFFFIENKLAKKFITINVKQKDVDSAITYIEKKIKKLPIGSYVRIRASKDNPVIIGFEQVKRTFISFVMSKITTEEEDIDQDYKLIADITSTDNYTPITITRDNITDMMLSVIKEKYTLQDYQYELITNELSLVI